MTADNKIFLITKHNAEKMYTKSQWNSTLQIWRTCSWNISWDIFVGIFINSYNTLRSSSVIGPVCSGGSADDGDGELDGDSTSSGSSALPRDQSSSVVSLGTPSLPVGPLSLTDLRISGSCVAPVTGSNHRVAVAVTSDAELECISVYVELSNAFTKFLRTLVTDLK